MFRKNHVHLQNDLVNSLNSMYSRLAYKLQNSWTALFYQHVFCQIDESLFVPLQGQWTSELSSKYSHRSRFNQTLEGFSHEVLPDE